MRRNTIWVVAIALFMSTACGESDPSDSEAPPPPGSLLSRAVDEAPGANCRDGGRAVQSGIDGDGDGVLDDAEVATTAYVCHRDRIRLVPESKGQHCTDGGTAVWVGDDANGNDLLEQDEVRNIAYICTAVLTRVVLDPAEAPCAAIHAGVDLDKNGSLGDSEVIVTERVCGDALIDNVVIKTPEDVARVQGVRGVVRSIEISETMLTSVELPNLAFVGGGLRIFDNPRLAVLDLRQLTQVRGDLALFQNPQLSVLDLPHLNFIDGNFAVSGNPLLSALRLPALSEVSGDYALVQNQLLGELSELPFFIFGAITVSSNGEITELDLRNARSGDITIHDNPRLITVSVDANDSDRLSIRNNSQLATVSFDATAIKRVEVSNNPQLTSITSDIFGWIAGDLTLENNAALASVVLQFSDIPVRDAHVTGNLTIQGSPIASLTASRLRVTGKAELANLRIAQLSSSILEHVGDDLRIRDNPLLSTIDTLRAGGVVVVENNPALRTAAIDIVGFSAPDRHHADAITVHGNAALEQFAALSLTSAGTISINDNRRLTSVQFPLNLLSSNTIEFKRNAALPVCQIDALFARVATASAIQEQNDDDGTCQ